MVEGRKCGVGRSKEGERGGGRQEGEKKGESEGGIVRWMKVGGKDKGWKIEKRWMDGRRAGEKEE